MKKSVQIVIMGAFIIGTLAILFGINGTSTEKWSVLLKDIWFWGFALTWVLMINEGLHWIRNGKRSDMSDLVMIGFLFFVVYLFTRDIFDSFIGSFSIYLLLGIFELKDYEVLNKILLITVITYNVIFFAGILSTILDNKVIRDTAFSMSFWLMLILGFAFFGRKYIVVWRFMSPQYLTLALYLLAWLGIASITKFTSWNVMGYIYELLIITNFVVYAVTGPLIDKMLGLKPIDNPQLTKIVAEIAPKLGLKPEKIKIRFGTYPIINAMAYGAFWDMRMGIIAPNPEKIPEDELKGIVAHELAHCRGLHTFSLTLISSAEIFIRKLLKWPVTYYDYVFAPDSQPYSMFWFIMINFVIMIFLYVFVRMFEAQADLNTKKIGYGYELAKGLYNLESFYASGREIGLNTMLLCDEPIDENHRLLDYLETAEYLNKMIINPSKGGLLSNFMNSHPPSYHRIIASLNDENISIAQEALMPILFLKKRNAHRFFMNTLPARKKYAELVTNKIKEEFKIESIKNTFEKIKRDELYHKKIGKTFVFRNLIDETREIATITGIEFIDDASEPIRYIIQKEGSNQNELKTQLNPAQCQEKEFLLNGDYFHTKYGLVKLIGVNLEKGADEKKSTKIMKDAYEWNNYKGVFQFKIINNSKEVNKTNQQKSNLIELPIFQAKYSRPIHEIEALKGKTVFYKTQSNIWMKKVENIEVNQAESNFLIELSNHNSDESVNLKKEEIVVEFNRIFVPIHNDPMTYESERQICHYLKDNSIRVSLFLKKAVNADEHGYIININESANEKLEKYDINQNPSRNTLKEITIKNIFGDEKRFPIEKIDVITFESQTIFIEPKKDISSASLFFQKISAKLRPEQILVLK